MAERLPVVAGDNNAWGTVLNGFLGVSMNTDGTLKSAGITSALGYTPVNKAGDTSVGALSLGSNALTAGSAVLGTNPASSGTVRIPNASWIVGRNAANSSNVNMFKINTSNVIEAGTTLQIGSAAASQNDPIFFARQDYTATPTSGGNQSTTYAYASAKGAYDTSHMLYNNLSQVQDNAAVSSNKTITNASRVGTTLTVTTSAAHGYANGDRVIIDSVTHTFNAEINGSYVISNVTSTTFDVTVAGLSSGSYTSGGITTNRPGYTGYLALVGPTVARGGLASTANLHADDVNGFFVANNGTAKATDAFYIGHTASIGGQEWDTVFTSDADVGQGISFNSRSFNVLGTTYSSSNAPYYSSRRARGTLDAPLRAKSGDILGGITGLGAYAASDVATGTFGSASARVDLIANEDQTSTAQGTRIVFSTTPLTTNSIAEKFRVAPSDGIDFSSGTFSSYQIRLKNAAYVVGRNNAGSGDVNLFRITSSDEIEFPSPHTILGDGTDAENRTTAYGTSTVPYINHRRARNTSAAPRRVQSNDIIGRYGGCGAVAADDSSTASFSGITARIDMVAQESQTASAQGTRMVFYTTPTGSTSIAEKFRVAPADGIDFTSATLSSYAIRFNNPNAHVTFGTTNGTKIGTATNELFAFHNATPVAQRAGSAQAAVATTSATNSSPYGFSTAAQADAIVTLVNELRAALVEKGLIKGSA